MSEYDQEIFQQGAVGLGITAVAAVDEHFLADRGGRTEAGKLRNDS